MSKEKLTSSNRGRYAYKIPRLLSAGAAEDPTKPPPTKRVCLGGRGREWAAESLKLLETMVNLDDAKVILEPMNPLKYPEYYNMVRDPIDLSKIMLKFHSGSYPGLMHFSQDVSSMFDNYKKFFKDSGTEAFHEVRRLSDWFDQELNKIKQKWFRICDNGTRVTGSTNGYTPRPNSLEARIQAIEAENKRIVSLNTKQAYPIRLRPVVDPRKVTPSLTAPSSTTTVNGTPMITFRLTPELTSTAATLPHHRPLTSSTAPGVSMKLSSAAGANQPIFLVSKSGENAATAAPGTPGNVMYMCAEWPSKQQHPLPCRIGPPTSGLMAATTRVLDGPLMRPAGLSAAGNEGEQTELRMDVSNIWFGAARSRPVAPVTLTDEGFNLCLKNGDEDFPFTIGRDEVIKCAAYFGNVRKHTLFLFVLPNCVRRLLPLGVEFTQSSLIIMFPPALAQPQVAQLVYLFWRMSRLSMFGDLFVEVDQKSALALLANIKPAIVSTVATDNPKGVVNASPSVTHGDGVAATTTMDIARDDGVDATTLVDVKDEPVDDDDDSALTGNVVDDGNNDEDSLTSATASGDGAGLELDVRSNLISKRLKIRYRPGILKHSKRRIVDGKLQEHPGAGADEDPATSDSAREQSGEEEGGRDKEKEQFTIIQWFPQPEEDEEEAALAPEGESANGEDSLASETSQNSFLGELQIKDENDLMIVPFDKDDDSDDDAGTETEAGCADATSVCDEAAEEVEDREDLVMTGEKIIIKCPITQQIMKYPVKNVHCNHCYDKQGVEDLIKNRGQKAKCPVTGCSNRIPLKTTDVIFDEQLSVYIGKKLGQIASR